MRVPSFAPLARCAGTRVVRCPQSVRSAPRNGRRTVMGPVEINGLPAHVPLAHAVVVRLPLTCLLLVAGAA
ncbi:hypothetical protein GCM10010365_44760 [Streptomyces poonensis]|uniref:Uncharacterized protein n=1 Tax=Streptomyces poonensis TaxID=68255 RepID=A0A918PRM5_9ACTN|nr:hypothetical protein GCM10010365_44760 [Streptomyces poonensis]